MSSIMRARSGLTGRWEGPEVIGGSFLELKVAGPSMLGIGRPDRHALPRITSSKMRRLQRLLPSRERVRSSPISGHSSHCDQTTGSTERDKTPVTDPCNVLRQALKAGVFGLERQHGVPLLLSSSSG